jgi:TatD DNase family protein
MMKLIDSHCHLYSNQFGSDRTQAPERAIAAGVGQILLPAIDSETHDEMLKLEAEFPHNCLAMMGVHPCSIQADPGPELAIAEGWLGRRKFVAVGEIGLDFYWDLSYVEQQYLAFRRQIEWAVDYNIPIVIHSRKSTMECIEVVKEYLPRGVRGVFHCFSGTAEEAKMIVDMGFFLGIGGVVTFKNGGLDQALKDISTEWMMLETDAPYLAPVPYRGKRNEPSYIPFIADKLAEIKGCTREEIARITTDNVQKLFAL